MAKLFFAVIPSGTKFDFMKRAPIFFTMSVGIMILSLVSLFTKGLNYGVDFTGGTELHVRFTDKPSAAHIREVLEKAGVGEPMVQGYGEQGAGEYLIRIGSHETDAKPFQAQLQSALNKVAPSGSTARLVFSEDRMYVTFTSPVDPAKIRDGVNGANLKDISAASVERFGKESANEYLVQFASVGTRMVDILKTTFGKDKLEVLQIEQVGPKVGKELRYQAIGATLLSMLFILIYVWFRFDFDFGVGAIIALFHDPILVLGVFSVFGLQFDLTTVAAVLTLVGYSINDTIVVYDRIRENLKKMSDPYLPHVINQSVNETLSRTILTSLTTFVAAISLLIWGGPVTFNFALAFAVGVVTGTYSSIFVAAPVTIYLRNFIDKKKRLAA